MRILDFLSFEAIITSLEAGSKEDVLGELVEPITKSHPGMNREILIKTLIERENLGIRHRRWGSDSARQV